MRVCYFSLIFLLPVLLLFNPCTYAAITPADEEEKTLRSEYLVSYRYESLPEDWEDLGIKEKSKSACQYVLGRLGAKEDSRVNCVEKAVGTGATNNIFYDIHSCSGEPEKITYFPPVGSIKLLVNYHYRDDGRLPYYKDGVFGKAWIRSRYFPEILGEDDFCLLYTSPSPRDGLLSRMPSSA